jgi:dTDP-4-amino-4,6-dideoxygalactose transaminase
MALTNDAELAERMRILRNHGIDSTPRTRKGHKYSMGTFGFNFRMPDPLAALGISQLKKVGQFNAVRAGIKAQYDAEFNGDTGIMLRKSYTPSSNHLYVIMLDLDALRFDRDHIFCLLRGAGIGVNVHYKPVYLLDAYKYLGYSEGLCPNAEWAYDRLITLPLYPNMRQDEIEYVIEIVKDTVKGCLK